MAGLFHKQKHDNYLDLSLELEDQQAWQCSALCELPHILSPCAFTFDIVHGLLAVGTSDGLVYITGSPTVRFSLTVPKQSKVKHLQIASSVSRLLCIDEHDTLHLWDLAAQNRPSLIVSNPLKVPVSCVALSPSHTHAFLALETGEIQTYDLLCAQRSPYQMPNMWSAFFLTRANDRPDTSQRPSLGFDLIMDIIGHPRDLNLLFIAYGGGVALCDLTQRSLIRTYELLIPPGAPGGSGWSQPDLLSERQPAVTCLSIHPTGHMFAVGYEDGCFAFWAIEDDEQPLLVSTLDSTGVNLAHGEELAAVLDCLNRGEAPKDLTPSRDPLFKLVWSGSPHTADQRGGESILILLGGTNAESAQGVTVLRQPALHYPTAPVYGDPAKLGHVMDPALRKWMCTSVQAIDTYFYETAGPAQDILLLPRESPHYGGTWDPLAIALMVENPNGTRSVEMRHFPPPSFRSQAPIANANTGISDHLVSLLDSMTIESHPDSLELPSQYWSNVVGGRVMTINKDFHRYIMEREAMHPSRLPITGGRAWANHGSNADFKLAKYQPHRLLITYHEDLQVRVQDISAQLLHSGEPLDRVLPWPLPTLTIDMVPALAELALLRRSTTSPESSRIQFVELQTEPLESIVVLEHGDVAVMGYQSAPQSPSEPQQLEDDELLSLEHVLPAHATGFSPRVLVQAPAPATAYDFCTGFLSVAYINGSYVVVDLRGPRVIYREGPNTKTKKRMSHLMSQNEVDYVTALKFTICGLSTDPKPALRLIVTRCSGSTTILDFAHSGGAWNAISPVRNIDGPAKLLPFGSYILDAKSGRPCKVNRSSLATCNDFASRPTNDPTSHWYWLTANVKGLECTVDITGHRLGRVEWDNKLGTVELVELVERSGSTVVIAIFNRGHVVVYSLPRLEQLQVLSLPMIPGSSVRGDGTGDFVTFRRHSSGVVESELLFTLFDFHRAYSAPEYDLTSTKLSIPSQPQPVSLGPPSLFDNFWKLTGSRGLTGEQLDALLAGPERPSPRLYIPKPEETSPPAEGTAPSSMTNLTDNASSGLDSLRNRFARSMAERSEALGQLQESFDSLEQGSKGMLVQAKQLAAKQSAKNWFGF